MNAHLRLAAAALALIGCGSDLAAIADGGPGSSDASSSDAAPESLSPDGGALTPDAGPADASADDGGGPPQDPDAGDLVKELLALMGNCKVASNGTYPEPYGPVSICSLNGAFFWNAKMAVDCDGQTTTQCNSSTDPAYYNDTSFHQSDGKPLDAAKLPYVVIPQVSNRFDYVKKNIMPGAVVIVIADGKMSYGVFGDEGPADQIGEASYAMNKSLGVDPNPATGGHDGPGVRFIAFTGSEAVPSAIEDHAAAATLGAQLAAKLIQAN
jgi:hypothetical protein